MGGYIDEKKYKIKDDGTITRGRICNGCGKESFSEGEYCEFCGAKIISAVTNKKGDSKTIGRKCYKCGKVSYSEGKYCEFCGKKTKVNRTQIQ